jgi:hypothetical protein
LSARIVLYGKSRDEIAELTARMPAPRLIDLLYQHVTLEPFFSPDQVAKARGMTKRQIVARCKDGRIAGHKPLENGWRIPHSAVLEWDEQTAVKLMAAPVGAD